MSLIIPQAVGIHIAFSMEIQHKDHSLQCWNHIWRAFWNTADLQAQYMQCPLFKILLQILSWCKHYWQL